MKWIFESENGSGLVAKLECTPDEAEAVSALFADFFSGRRVNEAAEITPSRFGVEGFDWGDPEGGTLHVTINGTSIGIKLDRETSDAVFDAWGGHACESSELAENLPEPEPPAPLAGPLPAHLTALQTDINNHLRARVPGTYVQLHVDREFPRTVYAVLDSSYLTISVPAMWSDYHRSAFVIPEHWLREQPLEMFRAITQWAMENRKGATRHEQPIY